MKYELEFNRVFAHPLEKVWQALSTPAALGQWLMETDFVPEQGKEFRMWCEDGRGHTETYLCKVLEIDPPRHMLWSWVLDGREKEAPTTVEFHLETEAAGTRVTVIHRGDRDEHTVERFREGWRAKLKQLTEILSAQA